MDKILLVLILFSFSCSQKQSDVNDRARIALALDGEWLSDSYVKDVSTKRSIYASRNYDVQYWGFTMEEENLLSPFPIITGFSEHEGGYENLLKFDSQENVYITDLASINKPFKVTLADSQRVHLDFSDRTDIYRKVTDVQTELRKTLFAGEYRNLLSDRTIKFSKDGDVTGINGRNYFELVYDFTEGLNYDVLILYQSKDSSGIWSNGELYKFKFNSDTLMLYNIKTDWEEMNHVIGNLSHLLIKE